jgi:hypothetical protein
MTVDLNKCKPGDKLKSIHGMILIYVEKLSEDNYYDHKIQYPNGSFGTRVNDGHTYRNPSKRLPEDQDIVEIPNEMHREDRSVLQGMWLLSPNTVLE